MMWMEKRTECPGHGLFTTSKGSHLSGERLPSAQCSPPFFSYPSDPHLEEHMGLLGSCWALLLEFVIHWSRMRPESLHSSQFPGGGERVKANCLGTNHSLAFPSLSFFSILPSRQSYWQIIFRCFSGFGNLSLGLPPDDHRTSVVI